jgi:uroporphyrin-3 C-methyltransferase
MNTNNNKKKHKTTAGAAPTQQDNQKSTPTQPSDSSTKPSTTTSTSQKTQVQNNISNKKKFQQITFITALFALIMSLFALIEFRITSHKGDTQQTTMVAKTATLAHNNQQQAQEIQQLRQSLTQLRTQLQLNLQQQAHQMQTELAQTKARIHALQATYRKPSATNTQKNWLLTESLHLLRLAALELRFNRNVASSLLLLKAADERLASLNDPDLTTLRQHLGSNLLQLQTLTPLDYVGLLAELDSLSQHSKQLPLLTPRVKPDTSHPIQAASPEKLTSKWRAALKASWDKLSKILVIRRLDHTIAPLAGPKQQQILQNNLRNLFQQAQWAILRNDNTLFHASLKRAHQLIKQHFNTDIMATQKFIAAIKQLDTKNIQPELPNISDSIKLLERFIGKQNNAIKPSRVTPSSAPPKNNSTQTDSQENHQP